MAFNPFHTFRRYQKAVFAVLAIICMLVFVLSSGMGRGDALEQLTNWATGSQRGGSLLTLYGKKYDSGQVYFTQVGRQLASEYMLMATGQAQQNLFRRAMAGTEKLDPAWRQTAQQVLQPRLFMQFGPQYAEQYRQVLQRAPLHIQMLQHAIDQAEAQKKTEDVNTLATIRNLLVLDTSLMDRGANEGYFGGQVGRDSNYEETADFLIWLHQADKLGIHLTTTDIKYAIADETLRELTADDAKAIDRALRERFGREGFYSVDTLYQVLGDELRARLARAALTGETHRTRSAIPGGALTPEESWDLYKDARTTVLVSMIDVPAKPFLAQVTATPPETELRQLYDKYRNDEPAPFKDTPGFKEPRKIQVEWLAADANLPYYRQAAAKVAPLSAAIAQIGCAAGGLPTGSGTGLPEAVYAAVPFAFADAPLHAQLEDYRRRELPWTDSLTPKLHDSSIVRPENVAILVGAAAGGLGTGAPPALTAPLAYEARAIRREAIDRGKVGVAMIGLGALEPAPLGVFGIPFEFIPKPLSLDVLGPHLREKAHEVLAKVLARADQDAFRAEVTKLAQDKDKGKEKAQQYVAAFVKERGLPTGSTATAEDVWHLGDDPGLAPLKDLYRRGHGAQDVLLRGFPFEFFNERSMLGESGGLYVPRTYLGAFGTGDVASYLYWLTEDREARTQAFDKARPKVEAAWKELEARKLAQKEADRLAGLARQDQGERMRLRDLAAAQGGRDYFELGPMARFMPQPNPSPLAGQGRQYTTFQLPQDRIPFPSDDMLSQLVALREKEKGTTIVVPDRPKDHYFVASLLHREEPTPEEFRRSYVHSMNPAERDPLLPSLAGDRRSKYRAEVIKELRAGANLVINKDARGRAAPRAEEAE